MKIVIIGGGAAGLTAAVFAASPEHSVTVLEQNEKPGKKLLATGNGRCNLTNLDQKPEFYRTSCPERAAAVLGRFPVSSAISFFTELGIYTKNRDGWIYPNSDQASSVLAVLLMEAQHRKVKIKTRETVTGITQEEDGTWTVHTRGWSYPADRVILTTGSPASEIAGSCDDGLRMAEELGIRGISFAPALCPLKCSGLEFQKWSGVRADGRVTLFVDGVMTASERGELQLTGYGISGIPVFQVSRYAVRALEEGSYVEAELDFFPDMEEEELAALLNQRMMHCTYKTQEELLIGLIPDKLIPVALRDGKDLDRIAHAVKCVRVTVRDSAGFARAQVCSGGVDLAEVTDTLESRRYPGLYFAGEVLDVDGACGGYNLQWAWSSGAVAGFSAAKEEKE